MGYEIYFVGIRDLDKFVGNLFATKFILWDSKFNLWASDFCLWEIYLKGIKW